MEKQFIPYELALKLKELGFKEKCLGGYDKTKKWWYHPDSDVILDVPLWQQAFDWFREKGYVVQTDIFDSYNRGDGYEEESYYYKISNYDGWRGGLRDTYKGDSFATIEEARLKCLEKLIELCEKN